MESGNNCPITTSSELAAIVGDVLGDLAFMVGDEESAKLVPGTSWMECLISYRGPVAGTLHCWCTREFALQLTANLLGMNPDDPTVSNNIEDALREFMNIVCGQYVTACYGKEPVFDLSIPETADCAEPPHAGQTDARATLCELCVSGEPFYCRYEPCRD